MDFLSFPLLVFCICQKWTTAHATKCDVAQYEDNGRCCKMCPPGQFLKDFCQMQQQTVCLPCDTGYFSSQYNVFASCDKCLVCQQNYTQKCTTTTNAICSCQHGFLCSNSLCSVCVENKCKVGEKVKQTQIKTEAKLMTEYSYECEPVSPGDVPVGHSQDLVRVILGIGFVSFTVILMILLGCFCMKKLKGHKSRDTTVDNQAITAKAADFQLSQEESGFALIIQDVSKDNEHVVQLNLEKVWFTNL